MEGTTMWQLSLTPDCSGNVTAGPQCDAPLSRVDVRFSWQVHDWRDWYRYVCPDYDIGKTVGSTNG